VGGGAVSAARLPAGANTIPTDAWLELGARGSSEAALARLEQDVHEVAARAASQVNDRRARGTPALTWSLDRIGRRPAGETPAEAALVRAAAKSTRLVNREPELCAASTDANAAIALNVPAIAIGAGGRGGDAHSTREWLENAEASSGVERALTIVAAMARM